MATKLFNKWRSGLGERLLKPVEDAQEEDKMDDSIAVEVVAS